MPTLHQPQVCGSVQERESLGQPGTLVGPCQAGLWAHPHSVTETLWISGDWLYLEGEQALLLRL